MYSFLKRRGRQIADELAGTETYFNLSPTRLSLFRTIKPSVEKYSHGRLLDAGAGRLAWESLLKKHSTKYYCADVSEGVSGKIDFLTDIQRMGIANQSFNTVFCSQVLEHVPDPQQACDEFYRVLAADGILIISAPHLSYLHNEPNDYFRFTKYGLKYMLAKAGFEIIQIEPAGGLLSFIGFIPTTILLNLFCGIPILGRMAVKVCQLLTRLIIFFDTHLEKERIYTLNYVVVAKKSR